MELSLMCPPLLCFLLLVFTTVLIIWKKQSKTKLSTSNPPPGPPQLPLIGNLHQLLCSLPHCRLADLAKTYGPLMQLQLGQISVVVVSSPELTKQFMKDHDINISERYRVSVAEILFYSRQDMAFAPYGEHWRKMRKISMVELFSVKRVQSFRFIREEEVSNCIRSINSQAGLPINVSEILFSLINSILARTVIGWKSKNQEAVVPLIHRVLKALGGFSVVDLFPSIEFIHVISGMKSRLLKLHREADEILEEIIKDHREELKGNKSEANNLLDVLLKLQGNPDYGLTTDNIKGIILDMFGAGITSSSTTLKRAMSELMKNPKVMKKAQQEVRKVHVKYGKLDETLVHELKFLKAIVKETLRLHPSASLIPRQCREKFEVNGYKINVNTEVLINVWAIGRDPNYWIEPEMFDPERFVGSEVDYKGFNFEFIPFGAGRRICPGIAIGIANIELSLARLLCHFNWQLPDEMKPEDLDMIEEFSLGVRRKNDLYLIPMAHKEDI